MRMTWVVVRQDSHGSRFDVEAFDTRAGAEAMMRRFESGYPHHQTYFVEHRGDAAPGLPGTDLPNPASHDMPRREP